VRSWPLDLKEELCNTGLAFMWKNQQECNLTEITKIVKDRYIDIEGKKNILPKLSEISLLTLCREMNPSWSK
jgi:hypothetical protein